MQAQGKSSEAVRGFIRQIREDRGYESGWEYHMMRLLSGGAGQYRGQHGRRLR